MKTYLLKIASKYINQKLSELKRIEKKNHDDIWVTFNTSLTD